MTNPKTASYGWRSPTPPHTASYVVPRVLEIVRELSPQRVLDLGAGNGALCKALADLGLDTVGAEPDDNGIAVAATNVPAARFYRLGVDDDPELLMSSEEKFDLVISTEVIEHLYSPHCLPEFAAAVLRDGGHLVISTPYHGYVKNLALSVLDKWDDHFTALWHGGHIKFWSRRTLSKLLNERGFEVISFHGVGRIPMLWKSMVIVAQLRRNA